MKRRPKLRKVNLSPVAAAALCAEASGIGGGEVPVQVTGWKDGRGQLRRVWAKYPNGWLLRFGITADNCATRISMKLNLRVIS